jgi:hypothetical protein
MSYNAITIFLLPPAFTLKIVSAMHIETLQLTQAAKTHGEEFMTELRVLIYTSSGGDKCDIKLQ